jgi:hypothetical protein
MKEKVLIVDDEVNGREAIREMLTVAVSTFLNRHD